MSVATKPELVRTLERAGRELEVLVRDSEKEIAAAGSQFEDLARATDTILHLAAGVIGCVENESVSSILPRVQTLGAEARHFIQERLYATAVVLDTVTAEVRLLERLSQLTQGQRSIARETQTLSVLTNIEVARLGNAGSGFQYLARQLDDFSQSVVRDTKELTRHTNERKSAIEETRRMLGIELPRMRRELTRIEAALGNALSAADASLAELSRAPAEFRVWVEEIAAQIAGVVAAIQAHDITRQQIEHVRQALQSISATMQIADDGEVGDGEELPRVAAGLAIQIYQLRSIRETVDNWISQIGRCTGGILKISSAQVVGIGPLVLGQERELAQQLARIEALEQECTAGTAEVEDTLAGLSNLMRLVSEHLERSRSVRDRLQLLTFNSIIEASRLGIKADAILEISQSIKRISLSWSEMTDRSGHAKEQILGLIEQAREGMNAFDEAGGNGLNEAQAETRLCLERLRGAAAFAAGQGMEIEGTIDKLQAKIAKVSATGNRLDACFARLGIVLSEIEELKRRFDGDYPDAQGRADPVEMEARFAITYTTERERDVLHAALTGEALPVAQQNLAGNDVELF